MYPGYPPGHMLSSIAVLDHPKKAETHAVAADIERALIDLNVEVFRARSWDVDTLATIAPKVELLIVLGGDGSTLRAARAAAPFGKPVAAVNFGRLGFLSEMTPDNWPTQLPKFVSGEFWLEERMMLTVECFRGEERLSKHDALNDAVIGRGSLARVIRAETCVDGTPLTTYSCDGLIVSTSTGSTAYALAAGGPIMPPDVQNVVLVPIAPHLSLEKPLILPRQATIEIVVRTDHAAGMSADGQTEVPLRDRDRVVVRASDRVAHFARVQPRSYFYKTLAARLNREDLK
jgi:NAD+ kinase